MLDIKLIRTNPDLVKANIKKREMNLDHIVDEILDIDAAGSYLAVLQSNALVLYGEDLTEAGRLEDTDYASHVLVDADGSALVIGGSSARRYLP